MLLLNAWLCVGLLLSLPPSTSQSCMEGSPQRCSAAGFAPGANLGGEGFDITTMERKGAFVLDMNQWQSANRTCRMCRNPFQENQWQKLPLSVVDWRAKQACGNKVSTAVHRSSEALVASSSSSVENNWKLGLDFQRGKDSGSLMLAGSHSKLAEYSMAKTKTDKFSFASVRVSCQFYSYRVSHAPRLNANFQQAVKKLPKVYNQDTKQQFYRLMDEFGTHYITKVTLGGSARSVTSVRQCEASLDGLTVEEVRSCLGVEASASVGVTVSVESRHCQKDLTKTGKNARFSSVFNDRFTEIKGGRTTEPDLLFSAQNDPSAYKAWLTTLPSHPDRLSFALKPLPDLLRSGAESANLRAAVSHYILERGLQKNCSRRCATIGRSVPNDPCVCECHSNRAVNRDCCPTRRGMAEVKVTVLRGEGLFGDYFSGTDGYVKVFFDHASYRSPIVHDDNNPRWNWVLNLEYHDLSSARRLKFEVWDEDNRYDDLLGKCEQDLSVGAKEDVCYLNHGKIFYKWEVRCAPGLGGSLCKDYKPSPISQSLRERYVSRHAHPIPKAVLLEMGVLVGGAGPTRKHNGTAEDRGDKK